MDILTLATLILTTWRLSSLLVNEGGPWDVFADIRYLSGVRYDQYSIPYGDGFLAKLFSCVWCISVWVGAGVTLLYFLFPTVMLWLYLPFALSAGAIITETMLSRGGK